MKTSSSVWIFLFIICINKNSFVDCIQCYQCDSSDEENCSAFKPFKENSNFLVDCYKTDDRLGHMCVKMTKKVDDKFYALDWRYAIRGCAALEDSSVSWGCRYYTDDEGFNVEKCFCSDRDGCNSSNKLANSNILLVLTLPFIRFIL